MAIEAMAGAADGAQADKATKQGRVWPSRQNQAPAGGSAVYGLGMIGAMVYFFGSAESPKDYALAFPKASVWPALVVYQLLKSLYG